MLETILAVLKKSKHGHPSDFTFVAILWCISLIFTLTAAFIVISLKSIDYLSHTRTFTGTPQSRAISYHNHARRETATRKTIAMSLILSFFWLAYYVFLVEFGSFGLEIGLGIAVFVLVAICAGCTGPFVIFFIRRGFHLLKVLTRSNFYNPPHSS